MPFRRTGSKIYRTTLPGQREVSLGVTDLKLAKRLESFRDDLAESVSGDPFLLDCVASKRTTLLELWQASRAGTMPALRARLDDVDLSPYIDLWQTALTRRGKPQARQRATYLQQVRTFCTGGRLMRSSLTAKGLDDWFDRIGRVPGQTRAPTKRRYFAALTSLMNFLQDRHPDILPGRPLAGYRPPLNSRPRKVWYPVADNLRLIDAAPEKYRAILAFILGTGADDGIGDDKGVLLLTRRDVNTRTRVVQVRGEKTEYRVRPVTVDHFAWAAFEPCLRGKLPEALLFEGLTYIGLSHWWRRYRVRMGVPKYRLHDSRHSYAVRHMQLGVDPNKIAQNLGHGDAQQVTTNYGVHRSETVDPELRALVFGPTTEPAIHRGKA